MQYNNTMIHRIQFLNKDNRNEATDLEKRSPTEKNITICIPVLNNYSGLIKCIESIEQGSILPDKYVIFDNGKRLNNQIKNDRATSITPSSQVSVAKTWNWFIANTSDIRIIINDDIIFYKDTLEKFVNGMDCTTISHPENLGMFRYSFFSLPDEVVSKVGVFDEEFFPAYYEDTSYNYRLELAGLHTFEIKDCNVIHRTNQTISYFNHNQLTAHHANFQRNENTYVRMWGGLPGHEQYTLKYNGKRG